MSLWPVSPIRICTRLETLRQNLNTVPVEFFYKSFLSQKKHFSYFLGAKKIR